MAFRVKGAGEDRAHLPGAAWDHDLHRVLPRPIDGAGLSRFRRAASSTRSRRPSRWRSSRFLNFTWRMLLPVPSAAARIGQRGPAWETKRDVFRGDHEVAQRTVELEGWNAPRIHGFSDLRDHFRSARAARGRSPGASDRSRRAAVSMRASSARFRARGVPCAFAIRHPASSRGNRRARWTAILRSACDARLQHRVRSRQRLLDQCPGDAGQRHLRPPRPAGARLPAEVPELT